MTPLALAILIAVSVLTVLTLYSILWGFHPPEWHIYDPHDPEQYCPGCGGPCEKTWGDQATLRDFEE